MKNKVDAKRLQELTGGKLRNPMSVETMDPHDEGLKISTGISVLDRFLWGGLPMGTLTVIAESNITGNDQIHLKDQIACEAINSGHNVFYFVDLDANINLTGERLRNYIKSDSNLKENLGEIFGQSLLETEKNIDTFTEQLYELADNGVDVFIIDDITLISGLYVYNQEFSGMTEKEAINLSISILGTLAKSKNVWVILNVEKCLRDIPDEKILDDPNELLQFNLVATAGLILHHDYDNKKGFEKEIKEGLIKVTKNRLLGDSNYKGFKTFHDPKTNRTWSNDKLESRKHNS